MGSFRIPNRPLPAAASLVYNASASDL